jgi:hypothetical protein
MDQIHLSPLVDQIQLALGHISNTLSSAGTCNRRGSVVRDGASRFVRRHRVEVRRGVFIFLPLSSISIVPRQQKQIINEFGLYGRVWVGSTESPHVYSPKIHKSFAIAYIGQQKSGVGAFF